MKIMRLGTLVLVMDLLLLDVLESPVLANTQPDETETDPAVDDRLTLDEMEDIFLEYPDICMNPSIQQPLPAETELRLELNAIVSLLKSVEFSIPPPQNPGHILNSLQSPVQPDEPDPVAQEYSCKARWWDLAAYGYIQHDMELYVQNGFFALKTPKSHEVTGVSFDLDTPLVDIIKVVTDIDQSSKWIGISPSLDEAWGHVNVTVELFSPTSSWYSFEDKDLSCSVDV